MPTLESLCPLDCPDTCSLTVEVDRGRITGIDASARNPFTAGFICSKVRRYGERVYSPLRLQHPQRRIGAKGEGRFERISWDDAIAEITTRFRRIIAQYGAEAILPYHYGGSSGVFNEGGADARFFHLLGASELLKTVCAAPSDAAVSSMYGRMASVPPADFVHSRFVLLWGANPSATSIHLEAILRTARAAGTFVAVIDPRRTKSAVNADLHLAPRPGTDVVLALAIASHLLDHGGADHDFLARHVEGFAAFERAARRWPIARAAAICDVPAERIAELAERYAAASPAVVRCGWGVERNRNGANAVRAILALPTIANKFGVRGGGFTMSLSRSFPIDKEKVGRPDLRLRPVRQINMNRLGRVLCEPPAPPIAALFVYNANPVAMTPDQNRILRGLARDDLFTVVHEQVMTDTAKFADLLLPATTVFEQSELKKSYGHYFLQYCDPVIEPIGESLTNAELFARLAAALELGSPSLFEPARLLADAVGGADELLGGSTPDTLQRERIASVRFDGSSDVIQFINVFPKTPSGKVELQPPGFDDIDYQPPPESGYPLILLSPASGKLINSIFGEFNLPRAQLEMHPADAAMRAIGEGEIVRVFNELGEVKVPVKLTSALRRGVVVLPKGLWRSSTINGSTATALTPDHFSDYGDGACFNDARVEVRPAQP